MCEYCTCADDLTNGTRKALIDKSMDFGVLGKYYCWASIWRSDNGKNSLVFALGKKDYEIAINYCPKCGRKLDE